MQANTILTNTPKTTEEILTLLQNQRYLERAIVAIFEKQTEDEKATNTTKLTNNVGFNGPDAHLGSYLAKYILKGVKEYRKEYGNNLSGDFLNRAKKIMPKYAKQLLSMAKSKQSIH